MNDQTAPDLAGEAATGDEPLTQPEAGEAEVAGAEPGGAASQGGLTGHPATGHPAVDAALRAVTAAAGDDPADLIPAFQAAHRTLRETLATIDEQ